MIGRDRCLFVFVPNVRCKEEVFFVLFPVGVLHHAQTRRQGRLTDTGSVLLVAEAPGQGQDAREQDDSAESDQAGAERVDQVGLAEINQAVEDSDNVIDAEDEGVEDRRGDQLKASVEVVELTESKDNQANNEHPGLPVHELVVAVGYGPDKELDR